MKWIVVANSSGAHVFELNRDGNLVWIQDLSTTGDFDRSASQVADFLLAQRSRRRFSLLQVIAEPSLLTSIRQHAGPSLRRLAEWTVPEFGPRQRADRPHPIQMHESYRPTREWTSQMSSR